MGDLPYIIKVVLAIGTNGSTSIDRITDALHDKVDLKDREPELFLTSPGRVTLRGAQYELLDDSKSNIAYLYYGNPFKLLKYRKY